MKDCNTIQEFRDFENRIIELVQDWAENSRDFGGNAVLAISNDCDAKIVPAGTSGTEEFPLENLVHGNEIDVDAVNGIANKFMFVR